MSKASAKLSCLINFGKSGSTTDGNQYPVKTQPAYRQLPLRNTVVTYHDIGISFFVCLLVNLYDKTPIITEWVIKDCKPSSRASIENDMEEKDIKVVKKIYAIGEKNLEISSIES